MKVSEFKGWDARQVETARSVAKALGHGIKPSQVLRSIGAINQRDGRPFGRVWSDGADMLIIADVMEHEGE